MGTRQPLDLFAIGSMVIFCIVMASQQVMLKAVAEDIVPVFQIALRSGISAALIILLVLLQRQRMPLAPENRIPALLIGVLFTLEFLFLGEALSQTSAGHATVFLYTSPIFAAIGLHLKIPSERMSRVQWLGILVAFGGIVLAFLGGDSAETLSSAVLWGDFLALLAGAAWGLTTVVVRASGLSALPARQTLLYQLLVAFVLMTLWSYMTDQATLNPIPEVWGSLAFHGIVVSFIAYLGWFWLLTKYKAGQLGILSFMTPVFGVLMGNWLLGESIESNFIVGSGLIIGGILLVSSHGWLSKRREKLGKPA